MNKVLDSTIYVVNHARDVFIERDAILEFSKNIKKFDTKHWLSDSEFDYKGLSTQQRLNFVLFFNAISFSYWGEPKWTVFIDDKNYDGAWGLIMCVKRALDEGIPILDFNYWANMDKDTLSYLLRGNTEIPLIMERFNILKDIGNKVVNNFSGDFLNFLQKSGNDAMELVDLLSQTFLGFEDFSEYDGNTIYFLKHAQLFVSDLSSLGLVNLSGINQLTACADYKLPQILRKLGILRYSHSLAEKIDNKIEIKQNSSEEVEIRACTVWAVEYIKQEITDKFPGILASEINDYLWLLTQNKSPDDKPYHRTLTITY